MYKILIILCVFGLPTILGLKCYVCTISASDTSDTCVTDPAGVTTGPPSVSCNAKYCTIKRQEYQDPPGRVASFYRGCESNPVFLNTMIEDADFKTYYRACTADLCNTGNGIQGVSNGNLGSGGGGGGNILAPGIGSDGSTALLSRSTKLFILLTIILITWQSLDTI